MSWEVIIDQTAATLTASFGNQLPQAPRSILKASTPPWLLTLRHTRQGSSVMAVHKVEYKLSSMASCNTCSDLRDNFASDWTPLLSTLTSSLQAALLPYSDELSLYYHRRLARTSWPPGLFQPPEGGRVSGAEHCS